MCATVGSTGWIGLRWPPIACGGLRGVCLARWTCGGGAQSATYCVWGRVSGVHAVVARDHSHFHDELLTCPVTGTLILDGYWQDERYFAALRQELRTELTPVIPIDVRNAALGAQLVSTASVAIHCRRHNHRLADGSRHPARGRTGLDAAYYRLAVERLMDTARPTHLCLFGDEPHWLADVLPATIPRTVVDWNDAPAGKVLDLWLMSRCRHFIVSNSTLSWWGAWLGAEAGTRVVSPKPQDLEYWVPAAAGWEEIGW